MIIFSDNSAAGQLRALLLLLRAVDLQAGGARLAGVREPAVRGVRRVDNGLYFILHTHIYFPI
jgi:hypothetical protein